MAKLDEVQQGQLEAIELAYEQVQPVLEQLEQDYEYAVYRAKKSVTDLIQVALDNRVPMSRVTEQLGFSYPMQLQRWMQLPEELKHRLEGGDQNLQAVETYTNEVESIQAVIRNPKTGEMEVTYQGKQYNVRAIGPDDSPWAARDESIPYGVYDLIVESYPGFVVLEND